MDAQMKGGALGAIERPPIPAILVEATEKAIKAGMKPDEFAKMVAQSQQNEDQPSSKDKDKDKAKARQRHGRERDDDEESEPERTYRNFDERRMGFLVIGDQHRFGGGKAQIFYMLAPPLDYSFCMINRIEEIVSENEQPQLSRNPKAPVKTTDERYRTSSIRLSYNVINDIDGLINVLYKILDGGPFGLCWLDLSFNAIAKLDEDTLDQLPNLKILYLHGNSIVDMTEIPKLQVLESMKTLTLHGNPVEQEDGYRISVLYYLPDLKHLDYVAVTKSDKANSQQFGAKYEPYWKKRHGELEDNYQNRKKALEVSYTEKIMKGGDNLSDDDEEDQSTPPTTKKITTPSPAKNKKKAKK